MPTTCEIRFDNPDAVYYSGQELSGTAFLTTDHVKTIRAIHIEINGYAKVKWSKTKTRARRRKRSRGYYTAHEQYLSSRTYTLGHEGGPSITLEPGNYEYTFRCILPPELPTSFGEQYGCISYEVVLTIDRPLKFDNVFQQKFTVIHSLDLNVDPQHRMPVERVLDENFYCWCFQSGLLEAKLTTTQSGFVPGQKIDFVLLLANESTIKINKTIVGLKKEIRYLAESPYRKQRHQTEYLGKKVFGNVRKQSQKEFRDYIVVPAIPPTSSDICRCIRINYYLTAKVFVSGCHSSIKLFIPITIGTIPLVNMAPIASTSPVIAEQPEFAPPALFFGKASVDNDVPPPYDTIMPPSYEEAITTGNFVDPDEQKHQNGPYVPKYPVYHNYSSYPGNLS